MSQTYKIPTIPDDTGGVDKANLQLLGRHLAAENVQDMEGTMATLAEDCVFIDQALGIKYDGKEGARRYYSMWWNAFGIITQSDHRHFTSEGLVISEGRYQGVHRGEFLGIAPTNRKMELKLATIITFSNGLMAGERFYWNLASLLTQLGVDRIPKNVEKLGANL
ncbi:MAG: hypothetical protein EPN76_04790 [Burkholderiaceae bacterium]|nr:MAG: hypothetical protein EPN76_04790 [Burkholderiaceae bacterium]TAM08647.1 MAG: hypothetical protein EPN67_02270 [Pusillimonas sp.]